MSNPIILKIIKNWVKPIAPHHFRNRVWYATKFTFNLQYQTKEHHNDPCLAVTEICKWDSYFAGTLGPINTK